FPARSQGGRRGGRDRVLMNVTALRPGPREMAPLVDIVVPVHDEEADLAPSVRRLDRYLRERFPFSFRITIADNAVAPVDAAGARGHPGGHVRLGLRPAEPDAGLAAAASLRG